MKLGRFDHHPDPAIDFGIEVDALVGAAYNVSVGLQDPPGKRVINDRALVAARINRAMEFIVGGDPIAIVAKDTLRELERQIGRP